ncbi:MAG: FG-GAP repeat protein [Planctomycetes bacterium]|nr:FG-GAP repeat protein [Planctomycetota bacterium]
MKYSTLIASLLSWSAVGAQVAPREPASLSRTQWSEVRAAYEAKRLEVRPSVDGRHRVERPRQGFSIEFDGRGFLAVPHDGDWRWGLDLVRYGYEAEMVVVSGVARTTSDHGRFEYRHDAVVTEWYDNGARAFEHGFTVHERPGAAGGELRLDLRLRGGLSPIVYGNARSARFVDHAGRHVIDYSGLVAFDANGEDLPARIEPTEEGIRIVVDDAGADYPLTIDPVVQQAYLKSSDTDSNDGFGFAVAISGDTAVVGAPFEWSAATGVDGDDSDNSAGGSGAAYVFVRTGGVWTQQAYLKASNTASGDNFGWSVAVHGDTIVVGAPNEDSAATGVNGNQADDSVTNSGAVYVFVRTAGAWTQQAYVKASNPDVSDGFGVSVSVSGDTVVVGADREDSAATGVDGDEADDSATSAGAAYVFARSGGSWTQQAYLKASNTDVFDSFGQSVSVDGDTAVVGSRYEDSDATGVNGDDSNNLSLGSGAAYVFVRSGSAWTQQAYLKAANADSFDSFGASVAVSGDTIMVGATAEDSAATGIDGDGSDNSAPTSGAAYVFARSGATWSQQAYLKAPNTSASDHFGTAVAAAGDLVVVSTGLDDSVAPNSGSADVFVRTGASWSHLATLVAANAEADDWFGGACGVSGDTVVVGAEFEDSGATGVGGDGLDNSVIDSGAAYVFLLPEFGGCAAAGIPSLTAPASSTSSWGITCPTPTTPCLTGPVIMFGWCAPVALSVPPPIGCGVCGLVVDPSWGTLSDGVTIGPGLPIGFTFCVQCGCVANAGCIDLSKGLEIFVQP